MVRHRARFGGQHLSCDNRQFACESACDCHAAVLLISLHSAQTKNAFLCVDRCVSGRYAASNWLGVSNGHPEPGRPGTSCFPMARREFVLWFCKPCCPLWCCSRLFCCLAPWADKAFSTASKLCSSVWGFSTTGHNLCFVDLARLHAVSCWHPSFIFHPFSR